MTCIKELWAEAILHKQKLNPNLGGRSSKSDVYSFLGEYIYLLPFVLIIISIILILIIIINMTIYFFNVMMIRISLEPANKNNEDYMIDLDTYFRLNFRLEEGMDMLIYLIVYFSLL